MTIGYESSTALRAVKDYHIWRGCRSLSKIYILMGNIKYFNNYIGIFIRNGAALL
jgi:hypothetical protein